MKPYTSRKMTNSRYTHHDTCAARAYAMHGVVVHLAGLIAPCFGLEALDLFMPTTILPVTRATQVLDYVLHEYGGISHSAIERRILTHKAKWSYSKSACERVRRKLAEDHEPTRRAVAECAFFLQLHYPHRLPDLFTSKTKMCLRSTEPPLSQTP